MFKIVAFGDSTTAPRGKLAVYADVLREELTKKKLEVVIINAGVPGNTTIQAKARFNKDVLLVEPDLVIIQFGINDAAVDVRRGAVKPRVSLSDYEANLRYFVAELRACSAKVILMTPNPMAWTAHLRFLYGAEPYHPGDPDGLNVVLRPYAQAVRDIARSSDIILADVLAAYDESKKNGQPINAWLSDGMHPNAAGQRLAADLLLPEIINLVKQNDE